MSGTLRIASVAVAVDVLRAPRAYGSSGAGRVSSEAWSCRRAAVLFATTVLVVLATSSIVASLLVVGGQPLTGLTGQLIPSGTALPLVIASWATALAPLLGFTALAILLSVWIRNPAIGVVGPVVLSLVMQLVGSLGGLDLLRHLLLTTSFESWHGLFAAARFYDLVTEGLLVSAVWTAVALALAYLSLRRRDITGG